MDEETDNFIPNEEYEFIGSNDLIENYIAEINRIGNAIQLGKFLGYSGMQWVTDWLYDAKANFENGTISRGHYDKIFRMDNNQNGNEIRQDKKLKMD